MASPQPAAAGSPPSAQVVGNVFVHQYYNILYQSPGLVYRFYQESSKLGRPETEGFMSSITTLQAINEKIMSLDYGGLLAEIKTVDAQESLNGGVLVLVTGDLTGKDNVKRNFTQSFFLATQDKGYFVLNDMFRYVEEAGQQQGHQSLPNGIVAPPSPEQEAPLPVEEQVPEQVPEQAESPPEKENVIEEDAHNPPEEEEGSIVEEETPDGEVIDEVPNSSQEAAVDSGSTFFQEEAPKKSYASILKVMKENVAPSSVLALAPVRTVPSKTERQAAPTQAPVPEIPAVSPDAPETSSIQESEADGHSIYVKGLPLSAMPVQLEEEFKKFGLIKPGGIQVRSHKQQGFCFGFIEFETLAAVQSAIEASPVMIGGRLAFVEEKRPSGSRVGSRGRFSGRMSGFRNEGSRGRGANFGGGRGYGRGDFSSKSDFGGRGSSRGGSSRGDGGWYQRVDHVGSGFGRGDCSGSVSSGSNKNIAPRMSANNIE